MGASKRDYYMGRKFTNKEGDEMEVILYIDAKNAQIQFMESGNKKWAKIESIDKGLCLDKDKKDKQRVGEIHYGFEIIEFTGTKNVKIKSIDNGSIKNVQYNNLITGQIKDMFKPSVHGVGYLGNYDKSFTGRKEYNLWVSILARCYACYEDFDSYIGTTVDKRWHSFEVFQKDIRKMDNHLDWLRGEDMELDKDLLSNDNKIYSKETCLFITRKENLKQRERER